MPLDLIAPPGNHAMHDNVHLLPQRTLEMTRLCADVIERLFCAPAYRVARMNAMQKGRNVAPVRPLSDLWSPRSVECGQPRKGQVDKPVVEQFLLPCRRLCAAGPGFESGLDCMTLRGDRILLHEPVDRGQ
jgi:hypothetical protein